MVSDGTRKSTVWRVDDGEETPRAVESMLAPLERDPHAFSSALSAAQAVLGGARPGLMRLDVNMPGISGLELLEVMRRWTGCKDLPVVMISPESPEAIMRWARGLGADGHLRKPITLEELESVLSVSVRKGQKGQLWQ